jgi:hypothetical protein
MSEAVKAANSAEKFTGDDTQTNLSMLMTRSGVRFSRIPAEDCSLSRVLRSLAQEDLDRSIDLAKGFKSDATHAAATLAIASAILEKKLGNNAKN